MKEYATKQLRNIALLGHGSVGKTSLAEAMLFSSGAVNRMGKVEKGTTVADFDEEELRRHISLSLASVPVEWKEHKINVLDTPGYTDFVGEVKSAIHVADTALVVMDAASGVEVGTELVWNFAQEHALPRIVVINKMDRENINLNHVLEEIQETLEGNFFTITLPINIEDEFAGVVDLVKMEALMGPQGKREKIPDNLIEAAQKARVRLIEAAAEADDELIMKYLEEQELTEEEIQQGLRAATLNGTAIPVLTMAATAGLGTQILLDALIAYAPSPADQDAITAQTPEGEKQIEPNASAPLAASIFKTTADPFVGKLTYFRVYRGTLKSDTRVYNSRAEEEERLGQIYVMRGKEQIPVPLLHTGDIGAVAKLAHTLTGDTLCDEEHPVSLPGPAFPSPLFAVAVEPTSKSGAAKLGSTLTRICEEDPTLHWHQEASTRQTILEGMGESHLNIAVRRMANRFDVEVETSIPKVPYQETITKSYADQYRHKKQTGGAGQFAEVHMQLDPLPSGSGFEYEWDVFGGAISRAFESSIEKGIKQVLTKGPIAGYPVVDIKAIVYDGKEHPVDSKDIAFQVAGREVFKRVMREANPVLLEPIYRITVTVPEQYTGDIIGDLNTKRARVQGIAQSSGKSIITATVPLAEVQRYSTDLRSLTQGRGIFSMEIERYQKVPSQQMQEIVEKHRQEKAK